MTKKPHPDKIETSDKAHSKGFWFRPRFDPVIHLGHIISIVSFIIMGISAWTIVKVDITTLDQRLKAVEASHIAITAAITQLTSNYVVNARQDERIAEVTRRVENNEKRLSNMEEKVRK